MQDASLDGKCHCEHPEFERWLEPLVSTQHGYAFACDESGRMDLNALSRRALLDYDAIARSTLAQWVGECGVQLQPLVNALAQEILRQGVLHADETPVAMLKPGKDKTHRAYL